jgi:hypothetical protein
LAAASPVAASCEVSPGSARAGRQPRSTGGHLQGTLCAWRAWQLSNTARKFSGSTQSRFLFLPHPALFSGFDASDRYAIDPLVGFDRRLGDCRARPAPRTPRWRGRHARMPRSDGSRPRGCR